MHCAPKAATAASHCARVQPSTPCHSVNEYSGMDDDDDEDDDAKDDAAADDDDDDAGDECDEAAARRRRICGTDASA